MHRLLSGIALAALLTPVVAPAKTEPPPTIAPPPPILSLADGAVIAAELQGASAQGINAPDVTADVASLVDPDPAARAAADARLSKAAIAFVGAEHGMDLDPKAVDPNFALRAPFDAAAAFNQARASGQLGAWLVSQNRRDPGYVDLINARVRYATLAAAGGWGVIGRGAPLKVGARDPRVPALVRRLALEGYGAGPPAPASGQAATNSIGDAPPAAAPDPKRYDALIAAAVADFQGHHALPATGVLDAATLAALNVSAQDRLAAIDVNLERARWLPMDLPAQRIEADIAGPDVTLFEDNRPTLTMRAVAGAPHRPTPSFASAVDSVVLNPPWYVPADIAQRELLPKGAAYLARNDFVVTNGAVMQKAGPMSALGYVKFNISDPYAVYLHDTPSRGAFASSMRWRSHGCVRLQAPRELAAALLVSQGWTPASIDQAIAAKATRTIPLKTKTPVYLIYRTAEAGDDGKVTFRADVYGWDAELAAAMAGHPLASHNRTATSAAP